MAATQLRDGCTSDLPCTGEDNCGKILLHKIGPLLR
jgi:hypothetical protein